MLDLSWFTGRHYTYCTCSLLLRDLDSLVLDSSFSESTLKAFPISCVSSQSRVKARVLVLDKFAMRAGLALLKGQLRGRDLLALIYRSLRGSLYILDE